MKKEIKKENKYLTLPVFEKHQDFMAQQFKKVFEKLDNHDKYFLKVFEKLDNHDKIFGLMLKELQKTNQEAKDHRMMMSTLNHTDIKQERAVEDLRVRVERLEMQIK